MSKNTPEATIVCPACSCLCDDIDVELDGDRISKIDKACRKGSAFLYGTQIEEHRTPCLVEGREVDADTAIDMAAEELSRASHPLIFGLDNSTLEAQAIGLELARKLRGTIDDTSSFCQGNLVDHVLTGTLPTSSLSDVPDTDLIVYWGANPHHSHPRHLSKFTLYKHPEYQEIGARRAVTAVAVEVRESETTASCHRVFKLLPRDDGNFIEGVMKAISGEETREDAMKFFDLLRRSRFCVLFVGLGLTYSLDNDLSRFAEMVTKLNKLLRMSVIPMVGHFNMRGFNQSLRKATGHVNRVSFAGSVSHGDEFSLLEQVKNRKTDCVMVIGADPFSSLPRSVAEGLKCVPVITMDPFHTATTRGSRVVIGMGVSGIEVGGTAVRMDGTEVALMPVRKSSRPSDEEVLKHLLRKVAK